MKNQDDAPSTETNVADKPEPTFTHDKYGKHLGKFFKQQRTQRRQNLRDLASLAGLNDGQISRVERAESELTLNATVKLCHGLEIHPSNFLSAALDVNLSVDTLGPNAIEVNEGPTLQDLENLYTLLKNPGQEFRVWISQEFEQVPLDWIRPEQEIWQSPKDKDKDKEQSAPSLLYPLTSIAQLPNWATLFNQVKILPLMQDFGVYLRLMRINLDKTLDSIVEDRLPTFSELKLSRFERNYYANAKFYDVLNLALASDAPEMLFSIAWQATSLEAGVYKSENFPEWNADVFHFFEQVLIAERYYRLGGLHQKFLYDLRKRYLPSHLLTHQQSF